MPVLLRLHSKYPHKQKSAIYSAIFLTRYKEHFNKVMFWFQALPLAPLSQQNLHLDCYCCPLAQLLAPGAYRPSAAVSLAAETKEWCMVTRRLQTYIFLQTTFKSRKINYRSKHKRATTCLFMSHIKLLAHRQQCLTLQRWTMS